MSLQIGFHAVPKGHVAAVVTHLEMRSPASPRPEVDIDLTLDHVETPDVDWYRTLFRKVGGEDWLWFSRLVMAPDDLEKILHSPQNETYVLKQDSSEIGLLELDFRTQNECELAFFGVASEALGSGAGRWLMNRALNLAWSRNIDRFHLHTCTLDHPAALAFYRRSGFEVTHQEIEIAKDPRLSGALPRKAAQHVPIIE